MVRYRVNIILIFLFLIWSIIVGQLFKLQILESDFYQALAQGQQRKQSLIGTRGEIFFKSGEFLASNNVVFHVFATPSNITNKQETANLLKDILLIDEEIILERLNRSSSFVYLKKDLSEQERTLLTQEKIPGIDIETELIRQYLNGPMASQVIGFLGGEGIGQYGLEGLYDEVLRPQEAVPKWGLAGQLLGLETKQTNGANIYLTLDYNIQFIAERLLEQAYQKYNIESGSLIVINPKTGAILALANFPNFDPNFYHQETNFQIFKNPVIQRIFEPGSIFKVFTLAAALDQKKINPETEYEDKGFIQIGGYTLKNYNERVFGRTNMVDVLERSINTGAIFAQRQLGNQAFLDYLEKFGFFELTGIDLHGEIFSQNLEFKKGYEVNFATASYGQGINITLIQALRAFTALANDGRMVKPYIVDKINQNKTEPVFSSPVISSQTASQTTAMMVSVIENGFSKKAKIPGYYLAGKTGTSQVPYSSLGIDKRGYSNKTWQTFIGFGPAFDPEFMILVKLDNPATNTAEYSAMPVFRDMAKYLIDYLKIPPDYDI
ncbi:MAG: penicillin-binding protein 2 [Candidatus Pacebacteria bacterium]|nr:penicillin-binding protein 2 [Candidatus Paceibacterota bacterium]